MLLAGDYQALLACRVVLEIPDQTARGADSTETGARRSLVYQTPRIKAITACCPSSNPQSLHKHNVPVITSLYLLSVFSFSWLLLYFLNTFFFLCFTESPPPPYSRYPMEILKPCGEYSALLEVVSCAFHSDLCHFCSDSFHAMSRQQPCYYYYG